jgi:hypothetical protein
MLKKVSLVAAVVLSGVVGVNLATQSSTAAPPTVQVAYYKVKTGDTFSGIAAQLAPDANASARAVLATALAKANGFASSSSTLTAGRILVYDQADVAAAAASATTSTSSSTTTSSTSTTSTTMVMTTTVPGSTVPATGPLASIPSNFNTAPFLINGDPVPASSAAEPSGNFRTICNYSHLAYDDPIVFPGQPGRSHLHMFFGNSLADANSTYASLRTTGDGTCQGGPLNRTAYWAPAVINATDQVVLPDFVAVYYKGFGTAQTITSIVAPPAGLKMIAGFNMADPTQPTHFDWYCEVTQNKQQSIPACPAGEHVGVFIRFPNCWDGLHLDSADHRSHMAYTVGNDFTGVCPADHPVQIPQISLGFWFVNDGNSINWHLSSDQMPGMPVFANGQSFHSDWFGAWDPTVLSTFVASCIDAMRDCQNGAIGTGSRLTGATAYPQATVTPQVVPIPPHP